MVKTISVGLIFLWAGRGTPSLSGRGVRILYTPAKVDIHLPVHPLRVKLKSVMPGMRVIFMFRCIFSIKLLLFTANLLLANILSYEAVNSNIRRLMERICLANWSLPTPESAWQPPGQRGVQVAVNSNIKVCISFSILLTKTRYKSYT